MVLVPTRSSLLPPEYPISAATRYDQAVPIGLGVISIAWLAITAFALARGLWALSAVTMLQAGAIFAGAGLALGAGQHRTTGLFDALAVGVLLASACLYVLPGALHAHAVGGSTGIAAGLIAGWLLHRAAGRALDRSMLGVLCVHAASAGVALGLVYNQMPSVGLALGVAIIAHKLPAGYALARALHQHGRSTASVALPAYAVGLTALPIALWGPQVDLWQGRLLGVAGGLFVLAGATFCRHLPWRGGHACRMLLGLALGVIAVLGADIALQISA